MAFGLPKDQRSQAMLLVTIAALGVLYVAWDGVGIYPSAHKVMSARIDSAHAEIDSLQGLIDKAKQDLASGSVEDLRRKVEEYTGALTLMRRLVPQQNDLPTLIDDITTRTKQRGVTIGQIGAPMVEEGSPFDTYRYTLQVYGHYDQLGEFLSDVASMARIVVPQNVTLAPATQGTQRLLRDTVGGLLEANLTVRTFIKAPNRAPPPGKPKTGGANAAAAH
jgi:Tfp pilus assembly protein PilO